MLDKKTLIPEADVRAALDAAITMLAQTSVEHAEEIGGYIHTAFRPNPQLQPFGVAMLFNIGQGDLQQRMQDATYPPIMANLVNNLVLEQLRKLPGVDEIFVRFEEAEAKKG